MRHTTQISFLALIIASGLGATPAAAGSTTVTASDANVLNLLSPFLNLNATAAGQATLTSNLQQAIATNNASANSSVIEAEAISEKTIFSAASGSITLLGGGLSYYGPGANLAGGLPTQAIQNGQSFSGSGNLTVTSPVNGTIASYQSLGGLGNLGGAFQAAVSPYAPTTSSSVFVTTTSTASVNPLLAGQYQTKNVVNLLVNAYSFTSTDLGVAKYYFANGTADGTNTAVAPADYTLPATSNVGSKSVYDVAYGVNITQANQNSFGDSRPVQTAAGSINQFDPSSITGLTGNPSFPSGHTTYAFTDSILTGMMSPQNFQSMLLSGSEYGNSRIALGVHYPLDIIASRAFVQLDLVKLLSATAATGSTQATNPYYYTNTPGSTTVLNLNGSFVSAAQSLNGYLNTQTGACGGSLATCAASNPYNGYSAQTYTYQAAADGVINASTSATNAAIYQYRLTYGLPTFSYAQAPRELTDTQGNTAAILLSTLYGGQGNAQAQALANSATGGTSGAGILGNLTTGTINQIIDNTEGQALQAFYGSQLSYWSRIDLYAAAGYFSGVTGALTFAPGDKVNTNVTVASGGSLGGAGVIAGSLTYQSGSTLTAAPRTVLTVHSGPVALQSGASVALNGLFLPGSYTLIQADANQTVSLGSVGVTGSILGYEQASLAAGAPALTLRLTSDLAPLAQTPNQRAVATAIDASANSAAFAYNANGQALYTNLINSGANPSTFDALGGAGIAAANEATLEAGAAFAGAIADQAYFGLFGIGPDTSGISHFTPSPALSYASNDAIKSPIVVKGPLPTPERDWRVWGVFLGGGANISADSGRGTAASTSSSYGGLAGLDYRIQPNWLVGLALGGSDSHFNVNALATSGDATAFHVGLYTIYGLNQGYYAQGSETISTVNNHTNRTVGLYALPASTLAGSFNSVEARTRLEFGRAMNVLGVDVTPFIAAEFASLQSGAFTENNSLGLGSLALSSGSQTTISAPTFLGFKLQGAYAVAPGWTALPNISLAWVHEFSQDRKETASLVSLPGTDFTVYGPRPASDLAQVKAGLRVAGPNNMTLFADFIGEFSPSSNFYGGKGGVQVAF